MKIFVDGEELFEVSETRKKVFSYFFGDGEKFIKDQLKFVLMHKYDRCNERLKKEWAGKFHSYKNEKDLHDNIFLHKDYKTRYDKRKDEETKKVIRDKEIEKEHRKRIINMTEEEVLENFRAEKRNAIEKEEKESE